MLRIFISALLLCAAVSLPAADLSLDFSKLSARQTPPGFRSVVGGGGEPGKWEIVEDEAASVFRPMTEQRATTESKRAVLAQLAKDPTDEHFPMFLYEEIFGDFTLKTQFKIVSGAVEQMAGIAFRVQDEKNYYYVRASALGNTFRFFKVEDGQRGPPIGSDLKIPAGIWHELSIECKGSRIRCLLNGKEAFPELTDHTFSSGKIAFWTKSDSVAYFADTKINFKPLERVAQTLVREILEKYPRLEGLKIIAREGATNAPVIIASTEKLEVGQEADATVENVLAKDAIYHAKLKESVIVTMPLHDRNGETIAAARITMQSFRGQTEQNALARALPVVQAMEERIRSIKNLRE